MTTMKKTPASRKTGPRSNEMRREYRFDYSKSKPNRFASGMTPDTIAVVLDPDVAAVFQSSEAVNALLRSVIAAMPAEKSARP